MILEGPVDGMLSDPAGEHCIGKVKTPDRAQHLSVQCQFGAPARKIAEGIPVARPDIPVQGIEDSGGCIPDAWVGILLNRA